MYDGRNTISSGTQNNFRPTAFRRYILATGKEDYQRWAACRSARGIFATFKNRPGAHGVCMENLVLLQAVFVLILVQTLFLVLLMRAAMSKIVEEIELLDGNIAEALRSIVENVNLEGIEPVNPLQMLLMKLVEGHLASRPLEARVIPGRASDGKFKSEKPLSAD